MTTSDVTRSTAVRPFGLIVAIFMIIELTPIFEVTMVFAAIPTLMAAFKADASAISWVITIFLLTGAGTAAIAGRLGDIYGRKKILIILMLISAAGSIISVITGNLEGVLIGRALQGTSAGLFPLLIGVAREVAPPSKVSVLISLTSGIGLIGGSLGGVAAGILLAAGGWRSMFIASAIVAIVSILVALALPKSVVTVAERGRVDVLGGILMAPAIAAILYGFTTSRTEGASPLVVGLIVVGALLFTFWILWELRIKAPMFNLRLFRKRSLVLTLVATAFVSLGILSAPSLLTPILQQSPTKLPVGLGLTPTQAGLYGLISGAIAFILSPVAGRVAGRFGGKLILALGALLGILGYSGFFFSTHNLPLSIVAVVIGSVGSVFLTISIPIVIVENVSARDTSEAVGLIFTVGRTLFSAIGTAIIGVMLASSTVPGTTAPTISSWNAGIIFIVITGAVAFAAAMTFRKSTPMDRRGAVVEALVEVEEEALNTGAPATTH
ncbi:MFS transporter [Arthrobacter sp. B2a2-09]|uniref:MFS transporter n=1 Tax=Arthrobacter sp. B2a2-09 TaxID=2952822 RepID=UPI0022CD6F8F|nr:MFS transporter [Arthrobacter sp. B2a2-09]MCZ9881953.1 MFS transporter [Arthrobacter sp. B2a2-09]